MFRHGIFTSESVSEGHPDKIADQISDAILDAIIEQDPDARVACETMIKNGMVICAGEVTTTDWVDIELLVRNTVKNIGYNDPRLGFDGDSCAVLLAIGKQSPDIAQGLENDENYQLGAGDQGMMFGYASDETDVLMPAPIIYSHRLMQRHAKLRKEGVLPWLRPDAKTQVSVRYENGKPVGIDSVVFSSQHAPDIDQTALHEAIIDEIIKPTLPKSWIDQHTKFFINPTGRFVIGGPAADCGLTGRKIIVDTYGGMARHGGGCFSGKDPTKVDRSGAYISRYVAKNIVAAGIAEQFEIQVSYAIGIADPISINVETFGTGKIPDQEICKLIREHFDLRPRAVIEQLKLLRPIYQATAVYGHFGRENANFTWERTDKAEELKAAAGLIGSSTDTTV